MNDLLCNEDTNKCELCGSRNEQCCAGDKCDEVFLTCVEGTCVCGGEGERCCAGICEEGLKCNAKSVKCEPK